MSSCPFRDFPNGIISVFFHHRVPTTHHGVVPSTVPGQKRRWAKPDSADEVLNPKSSKTITYLVTNFQTYMILNMVIWSSMRLIGPLNRGIPFNINTQSILLQPSIVGDLLSILRVLPLGFRTDVFAEPFRWFKSQDCLFAFLSKSVSYLYYNMYFNNLFFVVIRVYHILLYFKQNNSLRRYS